MIQAIIDKIDNDIKCISFDIFDTLIYRCVNKPTDIYSKMYERAPEMFPPDSNGEDFANARKNAETVIRRLKYDTEGSREVSLSEIYNSMPDIYFPVERLQELEIETECTFILKNKDIEETIEYIRKLGIPVILISDMYMSQKEIVRLLKAADVNIELFKAMYISSECNASKTTGDLYETVMDKEKLEPKNLLHIGDNLYGDIGAANFKGIKSFHYNAISNGIYAFPYVEVEEYAYRNVKYGALRSLRFLAANMNENEWFKLGAAVMGPFLTLASEWILDTADKSGINVVRPLMREGKFISDLLKNASKFRGQKYDIQPLYASRLSVFTASFEDIIPKIVDNVLITCNMNVIDAFKILKIEDLIGRFGEYEHVYLNELKSIVNDGVLVHDQLTDYLHSDDMLTIIRKRNYGSRSLLYNYLNQMNMVDTENITVDFGWRGSIQYEMDRCMERFGKSSKSKHLLYVAKPETVLNIYDGTEIHGYLGNWGSDEYEILEIFARFLELFFYCDEGTTVGYEEKNGNVVPITKKIVYPEDQVEAMKQVQSGIMAFQNLFLSNKSRILNTTTKENLREEVISYMLRLCAFPTKKEAEMLAKLQYDQNFGADTLTEIISDRQIKAVKASGFEMYYGKIKGTGALWNSGLNVLSWPGIYLKNLYLINRKYRFLSLLLMCEKSIEQAGDRPIVLIGAGENGKKMVQIYSLLSVKKPVYILDNDKKLMGSNIGGIPIKPINHETLLNKGIYVFSVIHRDVYLTLKNQILNEMGEYDFISYFEGAVVK